MDYRIVVIGAGGVGKSALTVRFIQGNFVDKYDPTVEDSYSKVIDVDGITCMLDIMDTAGQEEYSVLRDQYIKTGQGFVLAYSINNSTSYAAATHIRKHLLRIKESTPDIPIMLVGSKCDLESERQVSVEEGRQLADRFQCSFMEVSAKANINVKEAFVELVKLINTWREKNPLKGTPKNKQSCCQLV